MGAVGGGWGVKVVGGERSLVDGKALKDMHESGKMTGEGGWGRSGAVGGRKDGASLPEARPHQPIPPHQPTATPAHPPVRLQASMCRTSRTLSCRATPGTWCCPTWARRPRRRRRTRPRWRPTRSRTSWRRAASGAQAADVTTLSHGISLAYPNDGTAVYLNSPELVRSGGCLSE